MAKLPKLPITYGTCESCGNTNVPLVRFKKQMVCFDPCETKLSRWDRSKNDVKLQDKQRESFLDRISEN